MTSLHGSAANEPVEVEVVESGPGRPYLLTDVQALALSASRLVRVEPTATPGHWVVSGVGKVGVVRVGDVALRMRPKLAIERIFFLMGYSPNFRWRDDLVGYDTAPDLVRVLAESFVRQAERALGRGVLQGYVTRAEELSVVRGRLRVREQMTRRFGQITPLLVRHDDFTIDVAENQLVRAAAEVLRRVPGLDTSTGRRLHAVTHRLDDVTRLTPGAPLPAWMPTRRNAHYDAVLWFATMVLRHRSVDLPSGVVAVNGFVVEMSRVFEDFLTVALTDTLERIDGRVHAPDHCGLDAESTVKMKPDLVWYRRGAPVAVVDAKYKIEHDDAPTADLYQMFAYCTALGLPEGHLVYAKGNEVPRRVVVRNAGITLHVHALDLDVPPTALLAQITDLAEVLRPAPP